MNREQLLLDYGRFVRSLAKHSVCKRRGVAAMVVDSYSFQPIGWGVNGPAGYDPNGCSGIKDGCGCAHSEINTILNCGVPMDSDLAGIMILTRAPCVPCATAIVNCGFISQVHYMDESEPGADGLKVLSGCGVSVKHLPVQTDDAEVGLRKMTWNCVKCGQPFEFNWEGRGHCHNEKCEKYRHLIQI